MTISKTSFKFVSACVVALLVCTAAGCKKDSPKSPTTDPSKSSQKDILTYEMYRADNSNLSKDYNSSLDGNHITMSLPAGTNLTSLKPAFTLSDKATATVNGNLQVSQRTANDFTNPITYVIKAEDGSTKNYVVTIIAK